MEPYSVLGVDPGASEEEVADAYRTLAKRLHPDVNPAAGDRMREINAAYAELRRRGFRRRSRWTPPPGPRPGAWLAADVRRRLGGELVVALHPLEPVLVVADAATRDSLDVRLVVTDRRLLWLRDDAIVDRVRRLNYAAIRAVEGRVGRSGRRGELRVEPHVGRRLRFSEMRAQLVDDALWIIQPRLRAAHTA